MKTKSDLEFELLVLRRKYTKLLDDFACQSKIEGNIHFPDTLRNLSFVVNDIALIKWILEDWGFPKNDNN